MKKFKELLPATMSPAEQQEWAFTQLPHFVANSRLHWFTSDRKLPQTGKMLAVGVGIFDVRDLEMLDALNDQLKDDFGILVNVFNVGSLDELPPVTKHQLLERLGTFTQNPITGLWENGTLVEAAQGYNAKVLVEKVTGIRVT